MNFTRTAKDILDERKKRMRSGEDILKARGKVFTSPSPVPIVQNNSMNLSKQQESQLNAPFQPKSIDELLSPTRMDNSGHINFAAPAANVAPVTPIAPAKKEVRKVIQPTQVMPTAQKVQPKIDMSKFQDFNVRNMDITKSIADIGKRGARQNDMDQLSGRKNVSESEFRHIQGIPDSMTTDDFFKLPTTDQMNMAVSKGNNYYHDPVPGGEQPVIKAAPPRRLGQKIMDGLVEAKDAATAAVAGVSDKFIGHPLERLSTRVLFNDWSKDYSGTPDNWKPNDILTDETKNQIKDSIKQFEGTPVYDNLLADQLKRQSAIQYKQKEGDQLKDLLNKPYNWTPDDDKIIKTANEVGGTIGGFGQMAALTAVTGNPFMGGFLSGAISSYGEGASNEEMLKKGIESGAFMMVGGKVGKYVGGKLGNVIENSPLKNTILGAIATKLGSGAAFGAAGTATGFLTSEDKPKLEDFARNMLAGALFEAIPGTINAAMSARGNKARVFEGMNNYESQMKKGYYEAKRASSPEEAAAKIDELIAKNQDAKQGLRENKFTGASKEVKQAQQALSMLDDILLKERSIYTRSKTQGRESISASKPTGETMASASQIEPSNIVNRPAQIEGLKNDPGASKVKIPEIKSQESAPVIETKQEPAKAAPENSNVQILDKTTPKPTGNNETKLAGDNKYYVKSNREFVPVSGSSITIKGHEGLDLFVHKPTGKNLGYAVSEGKSGASISTGKTKAEAIEKAKNSLDQIKGKGIDIADHYNKISDMAGISPRHKASETVKETVKETVAIEDRTYEMVEQKGVKAFQYEHPQLKPHIQGEAKRILSELKNTIKGERLVTTNENGETTVTGVNKQTSPTIQRIQEATGASYKDIEVALNNIMKDGGRENTKVAKKIELIIDDNLSSGSKDITGNEIPKNEAYLEEKAIIEGKKVEPKEVDQEDDDLPMPGIKMAKPIERSVKNEVRVEDKGTKTQDNNPGSRQNDAAKKVLDRATKTMESYGKQGAKAEIVEATTTTQKQIKDVLEGMGFDVNFYESNENFPASEVYDPQNKSVILVKSDNASDMLWAAGHGFFHGVKANHPDLYKEILDVLEDTITPEQTAKYIDTFSSTPEYQKKLEKDRDAIIEEMLADESGNVFTDKSFWDSVYNKSKELFNKLINIAKELFSKITRKEYNNYFTGKQIEKFRAKFEEVVAEIRKRNNDTGNQEVAATAEPAGSVKFSLNAKQVKELGTPLDLPKDEIFLDAVKNTEGAKITEDGLLINVVRFQNPDQSGSYSVRTGVFYLPVGSKNIKFYKGGKNGYGGMEKHQGETLLRKPIFVKGATGGKAPEAAYDLIMGKKAYQNMRSEVLRATSTYGRRVDEGKVQEVLEKYEADPDEANYIVQNSKGGNLLPYAIQENIVAHAVRDAGYDSVLGYSKARDGSYFISEVFDVREMTYPSLDTESDVHPHFKSNSMRYSARKKEVRSPIRILENGSVVVENFDGITKAEYSKINTFMKRRGYDWRGAEDARRILEKFASNEKYPATGDIAEALKTIFSTKEIPAALALAKKAAKEFGTTTDFREAAYLTIDGKLLDFSEKRDGGSPGHRTLDHRAIENIYEDKAWTEAMRDFMDNGNIRLHPESGGIDITQAPNENQVSLLKKFIITTNKDTYLDMTSIGHRYSNGFNLEYPKGTNPERIINDINRFYAPLKDNSELVLDDLIKTWVIEHPVSLVSQFHTKFSARNKEERNSKNLTVMEAQKQSKYPLDNRDTWWGNANYKAENGRLVLMTPDEYLSKSKPLEMSELTRENVDDIKDHIKSGRKLDPLILYKVDTKDVKASDGRHRAIASKELGYDKVPVIDYSKENEVITIISGAHKFEVFKNPTDDQYYSLQDKYKEEYPNSPKGEPMTRRTFDKSGNEYVWMSGDAMHDTIENYLKRNRGIVANQNKSMLEDASFSMRNKETRTRGVYESVKNNPNTPKEIMDKLKLHLMDYEVRHNEQTMEEAVQLISEDRSAAMRRAKSSDDEATPVTNALRIYFMAEAFREKRFDDAYEMVDILAQRGTALGQAVQMYAVLKRITPEGAIFFANRELEKAKTDEQKAGISKKSKAISDKMNEANKEAADEVAEGIKKELENIKAGKRKPKKENGNEKENQETPDLVELTPEELLANRIKNHLKDSEEKEIDPIREMINTLFKVAQQTLPEKDRARSRDAIEFISEAITNREEYKRVWDIAQNVIQKEYADNPEMLSKLDAYFEDFLEKPFTENNLMSALRKVLKDNGIKLSEIIRGSEEDSEAAKKLAINNLIKEAGLSGESAEFLRNFADLKLDEMISEANVKALTNLFKDKPKAEQQTALQKLLSLANLGAFAEPEYAHLLKDKIKLSKIAMDELGIKISDLVRKHYTEVDNAGISLMDKILKNTSLDGDEALELVRFVQGEFDRLTINKKNQILEQMFKEKPKAKHKELYQRIIEMSNLGAVSSVKYQPYIAKKLGLPALTPDLAARIQGYADKIQTIGDDTYEQRREKAIQIALMMADIAREVPPSTLRKLSTLQTMFMLLAPKTIGKNIIGNSLFGSLDLVKDYMASGLDATIGKALSGERAIPKPRLKSYAAGSIRAAREGWQDTKLGIDTSRSVTQFDLPKNYVFKSKLGVLAQKAMDLTLKVPDRIFSEGAYQSHIDGLMELNGVTEPTEDMKEASAYYAAKKTFNDDNMISSVLIGLRNVLNLKVGRFKGLDWFVGDWVLKFPKIPGAILMRGIEYSPASIFRALWHISKPLYEAKKNGISFKEAFAGKHQAKFINSLAEFAIGTAALVALGAWLRSLGIITGRRDDNVNVSNFERAVGMGEYRMNLSALWRYITSMFNPEAAKIQDDDTIVNYDWAQPVAIGVSMGANIVDSHAEQKSGVNTMVDLFGTIVQSVASGAETITEMPLLKGIRTFFGGRNAVDGLVEATKSVPSSFVPQLLNNIRQLMDNASRNTYDPNILKYAENLVLNRIPGASKMLPPSSDVFGNLKEVFEGNGNNLFNVFLNPSYVTKYKLTPEAMLVINTMLESGEDKIAPRSAPKSFTISVAGIRFKYALSGEEISEFQRISGDMTKRGFRTIDPRLPTDDKVEQMTKILNLAAKTARLKIIADRTKSGGRADSAMR